MEKITQGFKPFKQGDLVWLDSRHLKLRYESSKLAPKHEGPFPIKEVLSPLSYDLSLPNTWRIHPVFHASLLMPYKENDIHGLNYPQPPPDLVNGEEEYKVEWILKH